MGDLPMIFDRRADFDPAADFDAFCKAVPAKPAVYLLADADDRPVQLLCVRNLRYSLKRRLGDPANDEAGPTRRVNYRELIRRVHYRRVDSPLEADWLYLEAARSVFPQTYAGMVGFRSAWFVHVDPDAPFPRYVRTTDLSPRPGLLFGPLEDKHAAARLIELVEDMFDLCRYYSILLQSPDGKACAYKEMGKCPAPCDGSIELGQYRQMIAQSVQTLLEPNEFIREHTGRMRAAAAELRFELAAKIKTFIGQAEQLGKGPFRHARPLKEFFFLAIQQGPRAKTAKALLISPGRVEEIAGLLGDAIRPAELLRLAFERGADAGEGPIDASGAERIGVIAHHLFAPKPRGAILRLETIDEKSVAKAYRELQKNPPAEEESENEGVTKELQAL